MNLLLGSAIFALVTGTVCHVINSGVNVSPEVVTQNILIDDWQAVPGQNKLEYCSGNHENDLLQISYVNLNPNPPEKGQMLSVDFVGQLLDQVKKGSYVDVTVKYELITLIKTSFDLCEQLHQGNITCPIEKGPIEVHREFKLPEAIPPGTYNVYTSAYNEDEKSLTCLKSSIRFSPHYLSKENDIFSIENIKKIKLL
ncbi:Phosphatidylglycerol/phosphatidylinositol transfer protein [Golovinomyces cichoracearum]|uniref:Phosphatidylglycerol/phosphatidylinositol transfer protein n=1 Tax=Golovinomyces cichoracearum TaxID=62708 RepID=A0A420HFZ7_9PEZI|nr:Phosphatidylglycerol/phosphatidylinositol transfer protein [Golovinomyces cichoracearum]